MSDLEQGKEYDGPLGKLKSSPWLCALDIPHDKDTIVQIEKVVQRKQVEFVQSGGRKSIKQDYGSLKFVGATKELGLGATLLKTLAMLFGQNAKNLKGKWIALFVDQNVKVGGETVCAVRIRARHVEPNEIPKAANAAPAQPSPREPGQEG